MAEIGIPYPNEIHKKALEWRIRIEGGDVGPNEQLQFEQWLAADARHQQAYDRATTVWTSFETLHADRFATDLFKPSFMDKVRALIIGVFESLPARKFHVGAIAAVSAVIAISIVGVALFSSSELEDPVAQPVVTALETGRGEFKTVTLSDNSELTLGPATQLSVSISQDLREIHLIEGAAVFDVAPDASRRFRVRAGKFTATALGTVFDVRNNGGVVRLAVDEGAVEAAHPFILNGEPTSMVTRREVSAGYQIRASADDGLSSTQEMRPNTFATWRDDRLRYVGAPLSELVADANRYSDKPIVVEGGATNLDEIRVTFSFDGNDLDTMLVVLPNMFPVTVDRSEPSMITIRGGAIE